MYRVNHGEVWLRNKNDKFRFELETPAVTAAIRGTEFNLRVTQEGVSLLTLLEGSVHFGNPWGELVLTAGEEGLARPGQAPTKRVILNPADAVQWALYYPGIFNPRELPLDLAGLPGAVPEIQEALRLYNAGHFPAARAVLSPVLARQPHNPVALTLQGWLWLQAQDPAAARQTFQRVQPASDFSLVGLALATYRLEDQTAAFRLLQAAVRERPPSPTLLTLTGYFALLTGQPREAQRFLEAARQRAPTAVLPQALLVQLHLVQNRKNLARTQAETLVGQAPTSPLAWLSLALVQIAFFDLTAATAHLQKAVAIDPQFVDAQLYLARLWLSSDYLDRAQAAVERALRLAPEQGEALALAGFVRLAFRDFAGAERLFQRAVERSPGLGEPHLGLGIIAFRFRQPTRGLGEILLATLLEPRIALYQAELGKALYKEPWTNISGMPLWPFGERPCL